MPETISPIRPITSVSDRAMTPDAVAAEIMHGAKDRAFVLRAVPRECRVHHNTRPPLFWESKVRAWWTGQEQRAS